jgi:hypothetical protein
MSYQEHIHFTTKKNLKYNILGPNTLLTITRYDVWLCEMKKIILDDNQYIEDIRSYTTVFVDL